MMKSTDEPTPAPKEKDLIYAEYEDNRFLRNDDQVTSYMTSHLRRHYSSLWLRSGRSEVRIPLGAVAYRGGFWGFKPPPPRNSEGPIKSCQTQPDCENC